MPYPGFPTDMQPQLMSLLTCCRGQSVVKETVFEARMRHGEATGAHACGGGGRERLQGRCFRRLSADGANAVLLSGAERDEKGCGHHTAVWERERGGGAEGGKERECMDRSHTTVEGWC